MALVLPQTSLVASPNRRMIAMHDSEKFDNLFVTYNDKQGYKSHPFVDYSSVHGLYPNEIKLDYFGFRNDNNIYLTIKETTS